MKSPDNCSPCDIYLSNKFTGIKCCGIRLCINSGCIIRKCEKCGALLEPNIVEMIHLDKTFYESLNLKQNYNQKFYGMKPVEACIKYRRYDFLDSMINRDLVFRDDKSLMDLAIEKNDQFIIKKLKDNNHVFDYTTAYHLLDDFQYLTFEEAEIILNI